MKDIFLICPVRKADQEVLERIKKYVADLESAGRSVYWPARDTNQNDAIGLHICKQNRWAIHVALEVHVWFDPKSQGSVFDFGMTFALALFMNKKIVIANPEDVKPTAEKSFQNVLIEFAKESAKPIAPTFLFTVHDEEATNLRRWLDTHQCKYWCPSGERAGKVGAIGGAMTYSFTHTTLGTVTKASCACGAEYDATDYESW